MHEVIGAFDYEKFFSTYPLPDEYQNAETSVQLIQSISFNHYKVVVANPKLPPLLLDAQGKWQKQVYGLRQEAI